MCNGNCKGCENKVVNMEVEAEVPPMDTATKLFAFGVFGVFFLFWMIIFAASVKVLFFM